MSGTLTFESGMISSSIFVVLNFVFIACKFINLFLKGFLHRKLTFDML